MNGISKGLGKVEVAVKWDPSPMGEPATDLDLVAATYLAAEPSGTPSYVVHFDRRSPDGTITLNRDSRDGKGFGWDEVMTLEFNRLDARYGRVVVGVVIQQRDTKRTFAHVHNPGLRIREGYTDLAVSDFQDVRDATAATVGDFVRDGSGGWEFRPGLLGFADTDLMAFTRTMGSTAGPEGS